MKEYERNILAGYPVEVITIKQGRGAYLCNTEQGLFLFTQLHSSKSRIPWVQYICEQLMENGFENVNYLLSNQKGEYISYSGDGTGYILKRWFSGRECDVRKEKDVLEATRVLAKMHRALNEVSRQIREMESVMMLEPVCMHFQGENLCSEIRRHNQELKKIHRFVRKRVNKDKLERLFLTHFHSVYEWADNVERQILESSYFQLLEEAQEQRTLAHGAFNYHNVILAPERTAVVNFEHFRMDTQMLDLYYFFRKVMEKQRWNEHMAVRILETYGEQKPIQPMEMEYLKLRLAYPEKFWKIMNAYYNSNKAWFSVKNLEKLEMTVEELPLKFTFLNNIFSFHL